MEECASIPYPFEKHRIDTLYSTALLRRRNNLIELCVMIKLLDASRSSFEKYQTLRILLFSSFLSLGINILG